MRDPRHDVLFEPIRLGPKTMKNRFYQTPHCTSFGVDRPGTQAFFRGMKAEGGWGAVSTEFCSVHPESDAAPGVAAKLWDESDIRNLGAMCDKVHEHGSLAGVELWHGGGISPNYESRLPARSPMQITNDTFHFQTPATVDRIAIREIREYYVAAAKRGRSAGFDIVNVHGAEGGSILTHFFMKKYNRRTDEYGGSVENRARLWRETIEMVREAVGDDCAITARFCIDTLENSEYGIRASEEGVAFIELCDHLVDFWDIQVGGWSGAEWGSDDATPSRFGREFEHRALVEQVRGATDKPIVTVGRFVSPDLMASLVRDRVIDIIGAARPSIADPFLPRKIEEGRVDEIRECIGCNICVSRFPQAVPLICTQNPTTGEEYRRGWHPEQVPAAANADRDVLVVGAGPSGLECAITLAKRGMRRVHLVDAAPEPGGSVRWISQLPGLGEWARLINYRQIQIGKLKNLDFIPNTRLSAEEVLEYGAELVVIATGSSWSTDGLNGSTQLPITGVDASLPQIATPEQIMVEGKELGDRVLVYDTDGYYMGPSLAERAAREGRTVTYVTPHAQITPYMFHTGEAFKMNRLLHQLGVELVRERLLEGVTGGVATASHVFAPTDHVELEFDSLVVVTQRVSHSALRDELMTHAEAFAEHGVEAVHAIGDCVTPRLIADGIFEGRRLAMEIDGPDPARARPYLRENRVLFDEVARHRELIAELTERQAAEVGSR